MHKDPYGRYKTLQQGFLLVFDDAEPSLQTLEQYFFDRKSGKVVSTSGDALISPIDLRWYIRLLKTNRMLKSLDVKSKTAKLGLKKTLIQNLLEPVTDVLAVAAAVNAGVFSSVQIDAVLYRFSNLKFGDTLANWGVHASETPLQVFLEEGLAPALVSTAQTATRDNIDPCWFAYLGLTDRSLFSIATYYLMFEPTGVEELLHLLYSTELLSGWKDQVVRHRLGQLSMLFPKRFGIYVPISA